MNNGLHAICVLSWKILRVIICDEVITLDKIVLSVELIIKSELVVVAVIDFVKSTDKLI